MKKLVFIIPLLGVSAFAGYYHYWNIAQQEMVSRRPRCIGEVQDRHLHRNARRDAEDDFARGHPRILTYGLPVHWINEYREVLARDYGVKLETVAGCVVSDPLVDYVDTYNETIEGYLVSVHGPDLFDKARREADALYTARHTAQPEPDGP